MIRVFIATSLDGFIAGERGDLSWLPHDPVVEPHGAVAFEGFMAEVGAMLMGRSTYDVVAGFDGWAYGDTPVLVATRRPLQAEVSTVRAVAGGIDALLDDAQAVASGRDVYVDGGDLVQQALAADRVDELIVTVVPVLLGAGVRLFGPLSTRQAWAFEAPEPYGTMVQLRARRQR